MTTPSSTSQTYAKLREHATEKGYKRISFQGAHGAYSDMACRTVFPDMETVPSHAFEDAFGAVNDGNADLAMIPIDNTLAGRVADVHHLLPKGGLHIIGETFLPIHHALMAVPGTTLDSLSDVHSHVHAIPQCRKFIREHGLNPHIHADTAGAAKEVAGKNDKTQAAIASKLAAEIYNLDILANDIQDADHNTTRFLILSKDPFVPDYNPGERVLTSLFFAVRHIPAALYKALGGFATNGINMTKLESYVDETFQAALFYCDVEGHPEERLMRLALDELNFYAKDVNIVGTYPTHPFREAFLEDS